MYNPFPTPPPIARHLMIVSAALWVSFAVNPRHVRPVFLKFEWSFEIYMSVLNMANKIPEFL